MNTLSKVMSIVSSSSTYGVGKLQAKAYAILTKRTTEALLEYDISPKEWALLGLLSEKTSLRPTYVAEDLGVEPAYVTAMASHLKKMKFVNEEKDTVDTRAKILCLTAKGKMFVEKTEPILRDRLRSLLMGVELQDIAGYILVLEHIIKNDSTNVS